MNKIIILVCLFCTFLSGCLYNKKVIKKGDMTIINEGYITVIGVASQDKGGALVESDSVQRYFIKGLYKWPENVYGKKVRARGKCIFYDQRELMKKSPYRQGYAIFRILKKVKWEVIE